jgi:hypothetical protein
MAMVASGGTNLTFSIELSQTGSQPAGGTYVIGPGPVSDGGDIAATGAITKITISSGVNQLFYNEGSGRVEILGFTRGSDVVHLNVSVGTNHIDNFAELQQLAKVSVSENLLTVAFDGGDALTLMGVSDLSPSDWAFFG